MKKVIEKVFNWIFIIVLCIGIWHQETYPSLYNIMHFLLGLSCFTALIVMSCASLVYTSFTNEKLYDAHKKLGDVSFPRISTVAKIHSIVWVLGLMIISASQGWYIIASFCFLNMTITQYFYSVYNEFIDTYVVLRKTS